MAELVKLLEGSFSIACDFVSDIDVSNNDLTLSAVLFVSLSSGLISVFVSSSCSNCVSLSSLVTVSVFVSCSVVV